VAGLTRADLGYSLLDGLPVTELIFQQFIPTCQLALVALAVAVGLGLLLGITSGTGIGWGVSTASKTLVGLTLSVPIYWSGTLVIFVSTRLLMPDVIAQLDFLALPALLLGLHSSGAIAQVVMANVQETLRADFVRTARAKGLHDRDIIRRRHAAVLPPIITAAVQAGSA
jgi:peptide/nickel transport system permease protein